MQEMGVWSLGWEDLLEKEMATHSSIPVGNPMDRGAWQATLHGGHTRVEHNLATKQQQQKIWEKEERESIDYSFQPGSHKVALIKC